jgi:mono/diheme cytochrome c family protein
MRNKIHMFKNIALYSSILVVLLISFNNCGRPFAKVDLNDQDLASSGSNCDDIRMSTFRKTFYPFFRANCIACHIEGGPGLGTFASPDLASSFASFSAAGVSKIGYMATNPAHKPPHTGLQNKPIIDSMTATWQVSDKAYLACQSKSQNGGEDESLLTAPKAAPSIYSATNATQTLTWELDQAADLDATVKRSLPMRISIDIKVLYTTVAGNTLAKGYIFSNPTAQLKDGTKQIVIEGLFFYINGTPISSQTTYTSLSRVLAGTSPIRLMKANANTLIEPIATTDTFQLYLQRIVPTSGLEDSPTPLTPILSLGDPMTGLNTYLKSSISNVFIMRDSGIARWCLSESAVKPASTESPCDSSMTGPGTLNGWSLSRPTSYKFSAGDGLKTIYLWVANEGLKINDVPAQANIQVDTVAPQPAVINSISASDIQVAPMSISHPNPSDVAGWCVFEQNIVDTAPGKPALDNVCWTWTDNGVMPTSVGFKEGGQRNVWVFVRDIAGNVSDASNMMSGTNPYGAISFSQLTTATDKRGVFKNRCLACHSDASNPGYAKLQLFNYMAASKVGGDGVLVSRINNALSPMPNVNTGLMPQDERDLIRLWTMPDDGSRELLP